MARGGPVTWTEFTGEHVIELGYTIWDDGVWAVCNCGEWDVALGVPATLKAANRAAESHLKKVGQGT